MIRKIDGYWLPESETRTQEILKTSTQLGRPAYQHQKLEAALQFCQSRQRALDIGGHIGMWTMQLLEHGFDKVVAFEPDPIKHDCFKFNVGDRYPASRWSLLTYGLGDREELVSLAGKGDTTLKTHVSRKRPGDIQLVPLDSLAIARKADIDFIKIDVEGFELFVVRGAENTIRRNKPVIVIEQKPKVATKRYGVKDVAAVELLESWGYQVKANLNGDYVMVHPDMGEAPV